MSTVDRVSQWSHRIFNTTANENNVRRSSNPFAQSNFQKNILMEDVFESSTKSKNITFTGLNNGITQGTKRIYSTFVGSINNFSRKFAEGIESIKEFCTSMKNIFSAGLNKIAEIGKTEIHIGEGLKQGYEGAKTILTYDLGSLINTRGKQITKMSKMDPQTEVKPMFANALKALEEEIVQAA